MAGKLGKLLPTVSVPLGAGRDHTGNLSPGFGGTRPEGLAGIGAAALPPIPASIC